MIYKAGINPCVKVPPEITGRMKPVKGYIPVKGTIEKHPFKQTLVPLKDDGFRLYVNGPMLKGAGVQAGDIARFTIEQDQSPRNRAVKMNPAFRKALVTNRLLNTFQALVPSRRKEILKYLNYLKTKEALERNIEKIIRNLGRRASKKKYR